MRRPEVLLADLLNAFGGDDYTKTAIDEVEYNTKHDGYLARQREQIERFKRVEDKDIPQGVDYLSIKALSVEAREKLSAIRPNNLGQASRISGVRNADISVLVVYLEKLRRQGVSRET